MPKFRRYGREQPDDALLMHGLMQFKRGQLFVDEETDAVYIWTADDGVYSADEIRTEIKRKKRNGRLALFVFLAIIGYLIALVL